MFNIGKVQDDLKSKGKVEIKRTKKGLDWFFAVSDQLCVEGMKRNMKFKF